MSARVERNKTDLNEVGFCFGKQSGPKHDSNGNGTVSAPLVNHKDFATVIPNHYLESYTGYYVRPFARTSYGVYYGKEKYFGQVEKAQITPPCSHPDNYLSLGVSYPPAQTIYNVVSYEYFSSYEIKASSTNHTIKLVFRRKPKTGIYTTASYLSDDRPNDVVIYVSSGLALPGNTFVVNETAKGKYEITLCQVPWKLGNTTVYMDARILID